VPTKFASNYQKPQIPNKFEVTVVNGGAKVLDLATVSIATKSGTNTCVDVLDGDNGINGAPTDTLKPGATVTFTYGIACMAKIGDPLELTASFGGSVVHIIAAQLELDNETPLTARLVGTFLVGAVWLPSMSTANNSLRKFKERRAEIKAKLISQDQLKFKQSKVFEFLISSFYRSIQQKLSVTALEAREILNKHLDDSSSREEIPELVSSIATLNFRNLSHSIQKEVDFTTNLSDHEKGPSRWTRTYKSISFTSLFKINPVLDAFPYALLVSLFCAGYISRNADLLLTCINVGTIFLCNYLILKGHLYFVSKHIFNQRFLTITAILSTSIVPPIILVSLDQAQFLGLRFQGSNFYFFSYFILAITISFLGYVALLIKLTFQDVEISLQNQFREGVDKEQIVTNEIARITNLCAKYIHGNLQSSLVSLSGNLKLAVKNKESEKTEKIIDEILTLLHDPELHLDRDVDDLRAEVLKKCALWDGLVDIHPEIAVGEHQFLPQTITQVMDCVEEMISNAVRHGKASAIKILIQRTLDGTLVLTCTDNGLYDQNTKGGLGFKIYQEASNGDWTISRTPDDNLTTVQILISS
jgi:signal transduction histidine kinase